MSGGFPDLGLLPELVCATQRMGWLLPSDVQDESIPLMLGGGDVMVAAETGSGKTGAFGLPAVQLAYEIRQRQLRGDTGPASAAAAAPAPVGKPALSAEDRSPWVSVAPSGLVAQSRNPHAWGGVRGSVGVVKGRAYFEVDCHDEGIVRVGWGTAAASLDLGTCTQGWGFGGTGKRANGRAFQDYGEPYGKGDVIGVAADVTGSAGGSVSFFRNGAAMGEAYALPPGARPLFPAVCLKNAEVSLNFGSRRFRHPAPEGYSGLDGAGAASLSLAEAGVAAAAPAASKAPADKAPLVLVLEPTRDLAEQTHRVMSDFAEEIPGSAVRCLLLCGGIDTRGAEKALSRGVEVVVGTPGRVLDFATATSKKGASLDLSRVRVMVLDEADRLVNDGEDRERIAALWRLLPRQGAEGERFQTCFFSATLHSPQIAELAATVCHHPTWVDLKGRDAVPDSVHHAIVEVDPRRDLSWAGRSGSALEAGTDRVHAVDRRRALGALPAPGPDGRVALSEGEASLGIKLLKLLALPDILDAMGREQCMVFCRTNMDCEATCAMLTALGGGGEFRPGRESGKENPYSAVMVGGAVPAHQRRENLAAFKDGQVRCLVCTDAVARGIDVTGLPFVINMTLPDDAEQYVHRSGRVGRADKLGLCISMVASAGCRERVWFLQKSSGKLSRANIPSSRTDFDKGGNCVWLDEAAALRAVEARLAKGGLSGMVPPGPGAAASASSSSSSSSSSSAAADPAVAPAGTLPRVVAIPLRSPSGAERPIADVLADAAPFPGTFPLAEPGAGGSAAPSRVAPTGRPLGYAVRFPPGIGGGSAVYGEAKGEEGSSAEGAARLSVLRPTVESLAELERTAQGAYLDLRLRFGASLVTVPEKPAARPVTASTAGAARGKDADAKPGKKGRR